MNTTATVDAIPAVLRDGSESFELVSNNLDVGIEKKVDNSNELDDTGAKEIFPDEEEATTRACDHPIYMQYFKMIKVGVAIEAVKQKMLLAGENPDILDDPEHLIPTGLDTE